MNYYFEGRTSTWTPKQRATYMNKLTRNQASTIFKARTRMLKVRSNYKNGNTNMKCRLCNKEEETQKHALEECEIINETCEKVTPNKIFNDIDMEELKSTAKQIEQRMLKYEESEIPCHRESMKTIEARQAEDNTRQLAAPTARVPLPHRRAHNEMKYR